MRQRAACLTMLTLLLNACGLATKHPPAERLKQHGYTEIASWLDHDMPKRIKRHDITGVGIAVIDNGQIVVSKGFGFADKEASRPVTEDTLFRAGSVTKSFTATGVMQLVEKGALDLDAPLSDAIPEFRINNHINSRSINRNTNRNGSSNANHNTEDKRVTLRTILSHHAGLPSDVVNGMWSANPAPISQVVSLLHNQFMTSTPGTVFSYSNIGYSLAGRAIELASGKPYAEYMQQHVLQPLGMNDSGFELDTATDNISLGYIEGDLVREQDLRDKPAGALITNTTDLAKFVSAIMASGEIAPQGQHAQSMDEPAKLLQKNSLTEMLTAQPYSSPYVIDNLAGLGWFKVTGSLPLGHDIVMHNGQTMAHSALVQISTDSNIGVVILTNSPAQEAIDAIAKDIFKLAYQGKYPGAEKVIDTRSRSLPGQPVSGVGRYVSEFGLINVRGSQQRLTATFADQRWTLRDNLTDGFNIKLKLFGFIPVSDARLRTVKVHFREVDNQKLVYLEQNGMRQLVASGLEPQHHSAAWATHSGEFELTTALPDGGRNLDMGQMQLQWENDVYRFTVSQGGNDIDYALKIISDTQAVLQGYGRSLGSTVTLLDDGQIDWLGLRYRPLKL